MNIIINVKIKILRIRRHSTNEQNSVIHQEEDILEEMVDSISLVASIERASRHRYYQNTENNNNNNLSNWHNTPSVQENQHCNNIDDNETLIIQRNNEEIEKLKVKEKLQKVRDWKTMRICYGKEERAVDVPDGASAVSVSYSGKIKSGKR